jgi:peptide/nickel transport system permease protein
VTGYLIRRVGQGLLVLWAAFTLTFVILYLLPSNPVEIMLYGNGGAEQVSPAAVAQLQAEFGFNHPAIVQYFLGLWHALHFNFGISTTYQQPVSTIIWQALPSTFILAALAFGFAVVAGSVIALVATYVEWNGLRQLLLSLPPLGASIPTFTIGLILLQLFSFNWRLFPAVGNNGFQSMVLPAATLAVPAAAVIAQVLAKTLQTTWEQPFIEAIRAKGASRLRIHLKHALRNAAMAPLTIAGMVFGNLLAGAVIVETVFARTGLGRLTEVAVTDKDIPMIEGLVTLSAATFVVINLIVDLLYPFLDPRISHARPRISRSEKAEAKVRA